MTNLPTDSILAQLASWVTSQRENIASYLVKYLLVKYDFISDAFKEYCCSTGIDLSERLTYFAQANSIDLGKPDLVGYDKDNDHRIIVEAKFRAGLTNHQPVSYLAKLST